jgi:hypothetical protein
VEPHQEALEGEDGLLDGPVRRQGSVHVAVAATRGGADLAPAVGAMHPSLVRPMDAGQRDRLEVAADAHRAEGVAALLQHHGLVEEGAANRAPEAPVHTPPLRRDVAFFENLILMIDAVVLLGPTVVVVPVLDSVVAVVASIVVDLMVVHPLSPHPMSVSGRSTVFISRAQAGIESEEWMTGGGGNRSLDEDCDYYTSTLLFFGLVRIGATGHRGTD